MSEEKGVEAVEEKVQEVSSDAEEVETEVTKKSKLDIAKEKIENAKNLKSEISEQIAECMRNIDLDIDAFHTQKEVLFASAIQPAEKLLKEIGIEDEVSSEVPESKVELLDLEQDSIEIKDISSGRFKGFFFALVAGIVVLFGWCYTASKSLGLSIFPEKVLDFDRLNKMFEWTSGQLGQGSSANIGATTVIIAVLLIVWIVYALIVSLGASNNLKLATETEEAMTNYYNSKEECKEKMKFIREHIQNSTKTLEKYKVIIEEQNAKIARALFLEEADGFEHLHTKTKDDIDTVKSMIYEVEKLLKTPVTKEDILTKEATEVLKKVNKYVNDHILKLYI